MKVNEFINNIDIISIIKSKFYYYDDRWNFPGELGFSMIEDETNIKLNDLTKENLLKMEKYLNDNEIEYKDLDEVFNDIWKTI